MTASVRKGTWGYEDLTWGNGRIRGRDKTDVGHEIWQKHVCQSKEQPVPVGCKQTRIVMVASQQQQKTIRLHTALWGPGMSLMEYLLAYFKTGVNSQYLVKTGIVVHICNSSPREMEPRLSEVQCYTWLHCESKASLGCVKPCLERDRIFLYFFFLTWLCSSLAWTL